MYDFDLITDRRGHGSIKYDGLKARFGKDDLIPLWIADMDFRTPDFIVDALRERLSHPVFGYDFIPENYFPTISGWVKELHGWDVPAEYFRYIPGIVKGIKLVIEEFLEKEDKVIIQTPVYHPFRIVPEASGHEVVYNPLIPVYSDGKGRMEDMQGKDRDRILTGYEMDFEQLESIMDDRTRLLILANPHNPGGICWSPETLRRLAEITSRHGVLVISDEIHGEMALKGHKHHPFASVCQEAASNSISFMAPSKTFNIAGVVSSYCIIPDKGLRERFFGFLDSGELASPNIFSVTATMAAYTKGHGWRKEMLDYVESNIDFVEKWLAEKLPRIRIFRPEASFLIWMDCRSLGMSQEELVDLFVNKAGLALNDGSMFSSKMKEGLPEPKGWLGNEGDGFMRINVGCPRSILETALQRLQDSIQ